ncbi:MAG: FAD-dependent thymidylate synthase [Acidilobaceae archaeon]
MSRYLESGLDISVKLISYTVDGEKLVAAAARVSLSRKPVEEVLAVEEVDVEKWILETFKRQHFSPWEHSTYSFIIDGLSRVASHQLVRHRIASYTQQSHRYTEGYLRSAALKASRMLGYNCSEKLDEVDKTEVYRCYSKSLEELASREDVNAEDVARIAYVRPPTLSEDQAKLWTVAVLKASALYYELLSRGVKIEDARYVIPGSVRTRIVVTMNARELIQSFLPLRMCSRTQWELRHIAWLMWRELMRVHPKLFKWAGPRCLLTENVIRSEPLSLAEAMKRETQFFILRCPELVKREAIPLCLRQAAETAGLPLELLSELGLR